MIHKAHAQTNRAQAPDIPELLDSHPLTGWVRGQGWQWFPHQIETLEAARSGHDIIVFAPTGAGKTLSGFLPSIIDLYKNGSTGHLHTLYISPLKALAVDVHRNLGRPAEALDLGFTYETRTGDTPQSRRQRQKAKPPDILMTTPESLALLTSYEEAPGYFKNLRYVIIDELHAFLHTKRADLLSLNLERLQGFNPRLQRIGLSATLPDKKVARAWLCRRKAKVIEVPNEVRPAVKILMGGGRMPWSGHAGTYAVKEIYNEICKARMVVVFVNTRAQAELLFQRLWEVNEKTLKIGLHHGSLERELRRRVEEKMAAGELNCVVATSSLDLGLDWADVDLVVQVGAPKGISRLLQRIGRSNHRLDKPSRALLVPTNRFEYLECRAALEEIGRGRLDGIEEKEGGLDVLAQHIFGAACSGPFEAGQLYRQVTRAWPYRRLSREHFDEVLAFVKDGGYALKSYERFSRLVEEEERPGVYRLRDKRDVRRYRMNIGTIVEAPLLKVMLKNRRLGMIEEGFVQNLAPGDTFLFGGEVLAYQGIKDNLVLVVRSKDKQAKIPSYSGGRMPLSTHLSFTVRKILSSSRHWHDFPPQIKDWLMLHKKQSQMPDEKNLLIETFPRQKKYFMVAYTFAGWNANQTLGFLVMRRMKRLGLRPLGFTMTDYTLAVWSLRKPEHPQEIFTPGLLYEDFEVWLHDTPLTKRLFRDAAVIAGLIERRHPGQTKTGRQILVSSDLIYDVLMKYEPGHILLRAAYEDARHGLIDAGRLQALLHHAEGHIIHRDLETISPMAVPAVLQIGRETLSKKERDEYLLEDMEAGILEEAGVDAID